MHIFDRVFGALLVAWGLASFAPLAVAQKTSFGSHEDFQARQVRHLAVLGMKLPHYKAANLPLQEALKLVWKTALEEEPMFDIQVRGDPDVNRAKISLEVDDVTGAEIIQYLAELTASDWQLRGWSGKALALSLKEVGSGPGEFNVVGQVFPLSTKGAALLGLRPDMKPAEVMSVLSGYGVNFDLKLDEVAGYDAKLGVLVVANWMSEASFTRALVRLANDGMKIQKPAK